MRALVKSIQKLGVLQPLLVRPRAGRFELIAGARRLAAAAAAALTEVPCLVHQADDLQRARWPKPRTCAAARRPRLRRCRSR